MSAPLLGAGPTHVQAKHGCPLSGSVRPDSQDRSHAAAYQRQQSGKHVPVPSQRIVTQLNTLSDELLDLAHFAHTDAM
jgi:hypothetical protein